MGRRKVTGSAKSGSLDSSPLTSIAVRIQPLWVFSLDGASTGGHQLDEACPAGPRRRPRPDGPTCAATPAT